MSNQSLLTDFARTKIVATIGPATDSEEGIEQLIRTGVNVFRINTAHGTRESHDSVAKRIRLVSERIDIPAAILIDLAGPKIRLGDVPDGNIECAKGASFVFSKVEKPGVLSCNYPQLIDEVQSGDKLLFADGIVRMEVQSKTGDSITCIVTDEGILRSRQGICLPGVKLSAPALTEADRSNAVWAAEFGADLVSLSFVRTTSEIEELRTLLTAHNSSAKIISKIEKREALDCLDEIIQASDAVMVARGDLGLEIEIEATPVAQKRIIRKCRDLFRPVIVATQMLESMHDSRRPTRAEASDVANAILDGADACMLSGETAIGNHPFEAVAVMRRIIRETEQLLSENAPLQPKLVDLSEEVRITTGVVYGAAHIADQIGAKLIVVGTQEGNAPRIKSKLRDFVPTVAVAQNPATMRQLCLCWGIIPISGESVGNTAELHKIINRWAANDESIQNGDTVVFVADSEIIPNVFDALIVGKIVK